MQRFYNIWTDIKKVIGYITSEFTVRIIVYLLFIIGLLSFNFDKSSPEFTRITIIGAIASSVLEISSRIWSSTKDINDKINKVDKKIDQITENGSLLMRGTAWNESAKLIAGLDKGDKILACNLVSWPTESVGHYIYANKEAIESGVIIKRLYADTYDNIKLAENQAKWVDDTEWKQNFKQILYDSSQPMIDHILALDQNDGPKWAVLWIYSPNHSSTTIPGFIIKDRNILDGLKKDFETKWKDNKLAWQVPNFIIDVKVVEVHGHEGKYFYKCVADSSEMGETRPTKINAKVGNIIAVGADKITRTEKGFSFHDLRVIKVWEDEDNKVPTSAEMLEELSPQKAAQ